MKTRRRAANLTTNQRPHLRLSMECLEDRYLMAVVTGDFNADGWEDTAESDPAAEIAGIPDVGNVRVTYGGAAGATKTETFHHAGAKAGDRFGYSLAAGDFDGDGFDDLAIGIIGRDINNQVDAGQVSISYGAGHGLLGRSQWLSQDEIDGVMAEANDNFGEILSAGDYNGDGYIDLAIGVPSEDVGSVVDAGIVNVLYGNYGSLLPFGDVLHQNTPGVDGGVESYDRFGSSLATGDFNGDWYDDLAVGVPLEDIGWIQDAGAIHVFQGGYNGVLSYGWANERMYTQDTYGVPGQVESSDWFGLSLAAGDFDNDGYDDLAVGAPLESIGTLQAAGAVNVMYGHAGHYVEEGGRLALVTFATDRHQIWHQDSFGIQGEAAAYDFFGHGLTVKDVNGDGIVDLLITSPGEGDGFWPASNVVHVIYGNWLHGLDWWNNSVIA